MNEAGRRWLKVPAADYDGHMGLESVGQTQKLSRIFADLLQQHPPKKGIAVLGCATGNGFEHIPNDKMVRVVGVDVNLNYLHLLKERHGERLRWLETQCCDVLRCQFPEQAFDHIHAALLFEYTDPKAVLEKVRQWLTDSGVLSVVLQHPSKAVGTVSDSPFPGVKILHDVITLVPPDEFIALAEGAGLTMQSREHVPLPQGKAFEVLVFKPA
ncbi:class I SAM-dependent methyltransferase [bacterium]|nr:class I SAM-dependent methyltransferase [bacterium]